MSTFPCLMRFVSGSGQVRYGLGDRLADRYLEFEADRLVGALRTHRDRAMVLAMLLAGLRRCEVLGLRFEDVQVADRRLAVVEGKGGHHRVVPAANRFSRRARRLPS